MAITKSVARRMASNKAYSYEKVNGGLYLYGPEGTVFIQNEMHAYLFEKLEDAEYDWEVQQIIEKYSHLME